MLRACLVLQVIAVLGLCSGCKIVRGLKEGQHEGHACGPHACLGGCPDGACGCPDDACTCPTAHCADGVDGHPNPLEPFHHGHQGPPHRGGVLSWLGHLQDCGHFNGLGGPHGLGGGGRDGSRRPGPPEMPPPDAMPAPGPSAGNVSYPYYTTRGPRDFLANDPRGIGP